MKLKFPLIAVFVAVLGLTACGGGGDSAGGNVSIGNPAGLITTDIVAGTGAEATTGKEVVVNYTGWLYNPAASDLKGAQFDTGKDLKFTIGAPGIIAGFQQGVTGMKVGGKRTIQIPSHLGYGSAGYYQIPPNAGLVFEVELTAVR
jgi:FKBP-type peptidyl-prolyl cis-trans isomerase FkpA